MEGTGNIDKMTTLSQVMTRLTQRGIHREFRMNEECEMKLENSEKVYQPNELTIIKLIASKAQAVLMTTPFCIW